MTSGPLAAVADAKKNNVALLEDIERHIIAVTQQNDRRSDVIHPSEMAKIDWCPRATAYRILDVPVTDEGEKYSVHRERIFQEGHDIHTKWQAYLSDMGVLWGSWQRLDSPGEVFNGLPPKSLGMPGIWKYREVAIHGESSYLIEGRGDGVVPKYRALIEVKSIGVGTLRIEEPELLKKFQVKTEEGKTVVDLDGLWKSIRRPLVSHLRQANIYIRILRESGLDVDQAIFIYENKATQAIKSFATKYDPDLVERLFDSAVNVKRHVELGTVPPRPDWNRPDSAPCKKCVWLSECWEMKNGKDVDPSQSEQHPDGDSESGSGAKAGGAGSGSSSPPSGRRTRTADRPHRTRRRSADGTVRPTDPVD